MTTTETAPFIPKTPGEVHTKRLEILARARALGWSQNELARRCGKDVGHVSRVLRGLMTSSLVWRRAEQVLAREERRRAAKNGDAA